MNINEEEYGEPVGDKVSVADEVHAKKVILNRKVKKAEMNLEKLLDEMKIKSDAKLAERNKIVSQVSLVEKNRLINERIAHELQEKYIQEVDSAMENQAQIRVRKLYHKLQIERKLPIWLSTLNGVIEICRVIGHDSRKRWRSKVCKIMKKASMEMEQDALAHESRLYINQVILKINVYTANEVMRIIEELKNEYVLHTAKMTDSTSSLLPRSSPSTGSHEEKRDVVNDDRSNMHSIHENEVLLEDELAEVGEFPENKLNGDSLGHHSQYLKEIVEQEESFSVPLPCNRWNDELNDLDELKYQIENTSVASFSSFDVSQQLRSAKTFMSSSSVLTKFQADFNNRKIPDISPSCTKYDLEQCKALILLRAASADGDFPEAWRIYKEHFDFNRRCEEYYSNRNLKNSRANETVSQSERLVSAPSSAQSVTKRNEPKRVQRLLAIKKPTLLIFKLMMTAFKNSADRDFDGAYLVLEEMGAYGYKPDTAIFNIMLQACVTDSRFRRAILLLHDMRRRHRLVPNTRTFLILLDTCRHALAMPAEIFDALRQAGLPSRWGGNKQANCRYTLNRIHELYHYK